MNIKVKAWDLGPANIFGPRFIAAGPGTSRSPGSVFFDFGPAPPPWIISNNYGKLNTTSGVVETWTLPVRMELPNAIAFNRDFLYVTDSGNGIGRLNMSTNEFVLWQFPYPFWGRIGYHLAFDGNNRIFFALVLNLIELWIGCLEISSSTLTFWSVGQASLIYWAPDIVLDNQGLVSVAYKFGTYSCISS